MPEKWENELRKLRSVERPSTLEDRVAEGPRHEPGRPARERVTAAVVAFAVCAAVGVVGYRTIANDDTTSDRVGSGDGVVSTEGSLVLELSSDADGPTATVRFGDREQRAVFEGASWCPDGTATDAECSSYIADFAFYPPVSEFLVVPPGTPIQILGPATIAKMHVTDPYGEPAGSSTGTTPDAVPADDGTYVFAVSAEWPEGTGDFFFGVQTLSDPAAAPDVLTVDCTSVAARVDTAVVNAQADGLHVRVINANGPSQIAVLDTGDLSGVSDAVQDGAEISWTLPPGSYGVGCSRDVSLEAAVPFELIDAHDRYAPTELACGPVPRTAFASNVATATPHADAIGQLVQGLADGDRIRGAGYGADRWRLGFTYVVDRGGEAVARVVLGEQGGVWTGRFEACEGSGVTLSGAIVTTGGGATGPTASTGAGATGATGATGNVTGSEALVVRCEGLGAAIDTPVVQLQPDGLHVEASNVGDAALVALEAEDGTSVGSIAFERPTETAVLDLTPGTYWLACISGAAGPDPQVPSRSEQPDLYTSFEVVAAG